MKRVSKMTIGLKYVAHANLAALQGGIIGDVAIFDPTTNAVPDPGAYSYIICTLCADSDGNTFVDMSDPIVVGKTTSRTNSDFIPPVAKVQPIELAGITAVDGNRYEVIITDYNDYNYIVNPKRISYEAAPGDTIALITDGLAAQINSDVSLPNLVAVSDTVSLITLTAKSVPGSGQVINNFRADYEILFNVQLGDNMIGEAVLNAPTLADKGCGSFREVRKMEETHKGYKGHLNRVIYPTSVNIQYKSDSTKQYDLLVIEHNAPQHTNTEGVVDSQNTMIVAVPQDAGVGAVTSDLNAIIAGL